MFGNSTTSTAARSRASGLAFSSTTPADALDISKRAAKVACMPSRRLLPPTHLRIRTTYPPLLPRKQAPRPRFFSKASTQRIWKVLLMRCLRIVARHVFIVFIIYNICTVHRTMHRCHACNSRARPSLFARSLARKKASLFHCNRIATASQVSNPPKYGCLRLLLEIDAEHARRRVR